jgi:hypothetical protein
MANAIPLVHNLNFSMLQQRNVNVLMGKCCCQITNVEIVLQTLFSILPLEAALLAKTLRYSKVVNVFVKADWEKTEVASVLTARLLVPICIKAIVLFVLVAKSGEIHLANAQLAKSKRMESAE